jgi:hypothetical protein
LRPKRADAPIGQFCISLEKLSIQTATVQIGGSASVLPASLVAQRDAGMVAWTY